MSDLNLTQAPASKASFIQRRTIDFGPATKPVNVYGRVFFCSAATGSFEMNFNDGEFFAIAGRGVEWALVGDDRYSRLAFRAPIATSIECYLGNFAYHENVVVPISKVAQTVIKPWGGAVDVTNGVRQPIALAPEATVLLPGIGAAGSGLGYRKEINVTNLGTGVAPNPLDPVFGYPLTLLDTAAVPNLITAIPSGQTFKFETSADLKIKNIQIYPLYYLVMEIFYTA